MNLLNLVYFMVTNTMFNQNSYDSNDQLAKLTFSGWLTARGNTVQESGKFGIDLSMTTTGGQSYGFECERRETLNCWGSGQAFPYSTVSIPQRKAKFSNPSMFFGTLNPTCDTAIIIPGEAITGSPLVFKRTANRGIEGFYEVPISLSHLFLI